MADEAAQQWKKWIEAAIPAESMDKFISGANLLVDEKGMAPLGQLEGAGQNPKVKVTRIPISDCLYDPTKLPPYLDIFELHKLFDQDAFQKNLLLKGPKGIGKTLSVLSWAAPRKVPVVIVECSEDTKKYDLMGSQYIVGTETVFVVSAIPAAVDIANEVGYCILAFEELNALTPQMQKQLNAITDFRAGVSMPHIGKYYKLREGARLWVVGTMNPSVYGGTYDLNQDLKSRFDEIDLTYPSQEQEKSIIKMVNSGIQDGLLTQVLQLAKETRQDATGYALSTRDVLRLINNIQTNGLERALQKIACKFEGEDKDTILKRISSNFIGMSSIKKYWGT